MSLKAARVNAGFTQEQVAEMMEISPTTLSGWENGDRRIKADDFKRLCDIYNVSMDAISLPVKSTMCE